MAGIRARPTYCRHPALADETCSTKFPAPACEEGCCSLKYVICTVLHIVYMYTLDTRARVYCVCCYKMSFVDIYPFIIVFVHQLHVILLLRSIAHVSIVCVIHWHFCLLQLEISMNELLLVKVIYARYGAGKQHVVHEL